jgi:arsenate reductase (thioredoxin)
VTDRVFNVLFLCTGNTARSILAESILRKVGVGRFNAFSAGSYPKGVNPFTIKTLEAYGYPKEGLRSKSWDEFATPNAPQMDFVFTVCDSAAGEDCPVWPGQPMTAHWGIEDPTAVEGTNIDKERAFNQAFRFLRKSPFTISPVTVTTLSLRSSLISAAIACEPASIRAAIMRIADLTAILPSPPLRASAGALRAPLPYRLT